jgi:hypothetical protein
LLYCEINDVKKALKLPLKDTSKDAELKRCLEDALGLVNVLLNAQGLTVPKVVPQIIVDSVKCFAAWEFQCKRNQVKADVFWQEANNLLCAYSEQFCSSGVSF